MTTRSDTVTPLVQLFTEAMSQLVSGLAVVTARNGAAPCGLLVSSICSYSVNPPSVLVCIDRASRSHGPLMRCTRFGTHLLGREQEQTARTFASRTAGKFDTVAWTWEGPVPRLADVAVYLHCVARRVFHDGDHMILIGEVTHGDISPSDPLVYYRRRFDWRLRQD